MHYYMVFFLSLAAGMDYEAARVTALASQFVDDNPITRPVDDATMLTMLASPAKNQQQLLRYHFTLSDSSTGKTLPKYANGDVNSVVGNLSPQLENLLTASFVSNPKPCAKYQFLGEFMHSYADTFSHRERDNTPFDALTVGLGVGRPQGTGGKHYQKESIRLG